MTKFSSRTLLFNINKVQILIFDAYVFVVSTRSGTCCLLYSNEMIIDVNTLKHIV